MSEENVNSQVESEKLKQKECGWEEGEERTAILGNEIRLKGQKY